MQAGLSDNIDLYSRVATRIVDIARVNLADRHFDVQFGVVLYDLLAIG